MDVHYYPVIIERGTSDAGDVGFGAFFPDLPGCVSGGDTLEDALLGAERALAMHVLAMNRDGDAIPAPSPFAALEQDPEVEEVLRTLVRVEIPTKRVRVNFSIAETLLHRVDATARERGMTRSGFLTEAARRMADSSGFILVVCSGLMA
ncbi:MAG: type II toxin-antitoxin system HicB family antitoxin [Magnetococcus sp. XQGC-1]